MTLSLVRAKYRGVCARLIKLRMTNVKLQNGIFSCDYDGKHHKTKVLTPKHVKLVGDWVPDKPIVKESAEITRNKKYAVCLAGHETIERYVAKEYGLPRRIEAHIVANAVEFDFSKRLRVNWNNYGLWVEIIYRKEAARRGDR